MGYGLWAMDNSILLDWEIMKCLTCFLLCVCVWCTQWPNRRIKAFLNSYLECDAFHHLLLGCLIHLVSTLDNCRLIFCIFLHDKIVNWLDLLCGLNLSFGLFQIFIFVYALVPESGTFLMVINNNSILNIILCMTLDANPSQ